jgi:DNA-directed RNA polymerase beta subunit
MFRKRTGHKNYSYLCTKGVQYTTRACDGMRTTERILKNAVLGQILDNGLSIMLKAQTSAVITLDSDRLKAELTKAKADIGKNSRYLIGLYESLKEGDITETEYRELKSTYELRMASLEEQINTLQDTIKASIRMEQALEKARNSALSLKTVADLTTDVIAQTIEKIIIHDRENIETIIHSFGDEAVSMEGGVSHE